MFLYYFLLMRTPNLIISMIHGRHYKRRFFSPFVFQVVVNFLHKISIKALNSPQVFFHYFRIVSQGTPVNCFHFVWAWNLKILLYFSGLIFKYWSKENAMKKKNIFYFITRETPPPQHLCNSTIHLKYVQIISKIGYFLKYPLSTYH